MKAVVWHGIGDIRLDDVPMPPIQEPTEAVIRLTAGAICGTDLHFVRGTAADIKLGMTPGHEVAGIVAELSGYCPFCHRGKYAQCNNFNPSGPLDGLQAELPAFHLPVPRRRCRTKSATIKPSSFPTSSRQHTSTRTSPASSRATPWHGRSLCRR